MSDSPGHRPPTSDVRMRGFARRTTVEDALAWLDGNCSALPCERVPLRAAAGRTLSEPITSDVDVPDFDRAMMDGFAVRAADVQGASSYNRLRLSIIGEALPGRAYADPVQPGQAVRIMTGSPLPPGADAVLPAEVAEVKGPELHALVDVSPGKHVGRRGEDVASGSRVLPSGRLLRPQDVGLLSSIGIGEVSVVRRPRVRIVVTGNELLPAGERPSGCRIPDANGPMLEALVSRDGGIAIHPGIVPDEPAAISAALRDEADLVLVSGGSSVGQEDYAPLLVAEHGELAIHGIAMRPSSPTGLGHVDGRVVILLPGNPVSCLCAYDFFAGRAIRLLGGRRAQWPYHQHRLPLARKLVSVVGRLDYARVKIAQGRVEPLSIGGASVLSSTTRADGFVVVPADSEGYPPGAEVTVYLYDASHLAAPPL
ncbi:MAG: gephyrin-like molybdotransferase Glp [Pirellulales bacterium]